VQPYSAGRLQKLVPVLPPVVRWARALAAGKTFLAE
jgi:hypothetical protein